MAPNKLKVLVFPEEDGWMAVCLEHYVVGQGRVPDRALENLQHALAVHKQLDEDAKREPFLPVTFVLGSTRTIYRIDLGYWFWGNPTPEELRQTLRQINREEQPTFSAQAVWEAGGAAAPEEGIAAEVVWIREDSQGREFQRGVHAGPVPKLGAELGRSTLYQRPFIVHEIEKTGGRTAIHLRRAA